MKELMRGGFGSTAALLGLSLNAIASAQSPVSVPTDGALPPPVTTAAPGASGEAIARGRALFSQNCAVCHGLTAHGGPGGAPDLTRSPIAMAGDAGASLQSFLEAGRPARGMPAHPVSRAQAADLSAALHAMARATDNEEDNQVLVGNAAAGERFFNGPVGRCGSCHAVQAGVNSPAENLAHIGSKYTDPMTLQDQMLLMDRRFFWSPANSNEVSATVTFADGHTVSGYLLSVSDFKVFLRDAAGHTTVISRHDGEPKVLVHDRLQYHIDLLRVYHDNQIHDLTAYLATLK